jgi:glycosyltransferase involved in cell wall biosynthesis
MINLQTPINSLGYGVAGYNILKELFARDDSVALYPIGKPDQTDDFIAKAISNISNLKLNRSHVKIWHQHDLFQRVGNGKHFGFPIFELTEFDQREKVSLHHCDELLVCSKWASEIVDNQTGIKASVVPLGVDTKIFYPNSQYQVHNPYKTIFFNCGKWEKRKGHDILGECFNKAFTKYDNVELWMMCDNPFLKPEQKEYWEKLYKTSGLGDKIRLIPRQQRHEDVARLMNMADCGVFPARAEGWNLELLEMMACGKHVITTNYSAHTEFCSPVNSRLINIENLETAFDGVFFDGKKGLWAELSCDQENVVIEYMRDVHRLKQGGQLMVNNNGIETANKFSWKNTVDKLLEAINE